MRIARTTFWVVIVGVLLSAWSAARAQCDCSGCDAAPAAAALPTYGGCLWSRSNLTGDWCGKRTQLAQNGITFQGDITQFYQGNTSGGLDHRFEYGVHSDRIFNFDLGTLMGWQGWSLKVRHETQLGDFINRDTGALLAANSVGLFPVPGQDQTAVTNFTLTKMLSPTVGVFAGKLDTLDGDFNAYAHGRGKTQFMNIGLVATPIAFRTSPYSTWGAGMVVLGQEGTPVFNLSVIDPRSFATTINLDEVFAEGVTLAAEVRLPTCFLGQPGHHLFGGIWSNRDVALLTSAPLLILPPSPPLPTSNESWSLYWNFDQQLVQDRRDPTKGWGVFGRAAYADDDTNPIAWFLSFGMGGTSPLHGRQNDTFGSGWFYSSTSDDLPAVLGDHAQGVEVFYNYAATPWLNITPDIQVIDPSRRGVSPAVVFGVRVRMLL